MRRNTHLLSLNTLYGIKRVVLDSVRLNDFCKFLEEKTPIRPNHVSILNWCVGVLALYLLFVNHSGFVVLIILNFVLDNLDGYYARSRGLQTKLGEWLDHFGDFAFGELFMYKTFLTFGDWWILTAMLTFLIEAVVIWRLGMLQEKFPSRVFLSFFVFGYYKLGMIVQSIYQPVTLIIFLGVRYMMGELSFAEEVNETD